MIRHWLMVVAPIEAGVEGLGETVQELAAFFYVDDRLFALRQTEMLQRSLNKLIYLFDQIGLCKNMRKTVNIDCRPCSIPGGFSESAYMWQVMGIGPSYWERLRWRVK